MTNKIFKSMYDVKKEDFKPNDEMDDLACQAMNSTWNTVAYDIFECCEKNSLRRSEVLEIVLDANYMETNGNSTVEVCAYTICMSNFYPTHWKKLSKKAFPYATYGY